MSYQLTYYLYLIHLIRFLFTSCLLLYLVCQSAFCCCDRIPKINNLKEESLILAHGLRGFGPWFLGSVVFGLWESRTSCRFKAARLVVARKQVWGAGEESFPKAP
jgi:hypothetical protein